MCMLHMCMHAHVRKHGKYGQYGKYGKNKRMCRHTQPGNTFPLLLCTMCQKLHFVQFWSTPGACEACVCACVRAMCVPYACHVRAIRACHTRVPYRCHTHAVVCHTCAILMPYLCHSRAPYSYHTCAILAPHLCRTEVASSRHPR